MKWVCITKNFNNFTYGKIYEGYVISVERNSLLDIPNDKGERHLPAKFGYNGPGVFVEYFVSLDKWQEIRRGKINQVLGMPYNSN
jgi:hypothetical protein